MQKLATADMVIQSNRVVFITENNLLAFLIITEDTPRGQEGVGLAAGRPSSGRSLRGPKALKVLLGPLQ